MRVINERGITMIALVVTIVILLILSRISIGVLTGENGLIKQSQNAKTQTETAEEKEVLDTATVKAMGKDRYGNIEKIYLEKELEDYNVIIMPLGENFTAEFESGRKYNIKQDGSLILKEGILAADIVNAADKSEFYGNYITNYTSDYDEGINANDKEKWQIFLADNSNIYLIASNNISRYYTKTKDGVGYNYDTSETDTKTVYRMWMTDISNKYIDNEVFIETLSKFEFTTLTNYHKWMSKTENQSKNYSSKRQVASMIDIDLWDGYCNTKYANYAIGGPSLEMFCASYNDIHNQSISYQESTDGIGYNVKTTGDYAQSVRNLISSPALEVDKMYFKANYWLASPSSHSNSGCVMCVHNNTGGIWYNGWDWNSGFRPIVCLSPDVQIIKNTDGTGYSIVE